MSKYLTTPREIVAQALNISIDDINEDSAYGETQNWDSINHVDIINSLESTYEIEIPDSDVEKYYSMKAIIDLYEKLKES